MEFVVIAALLGFIPAFIARSKGRPMARWWVYGALVFPVALVHVLLARRLTAAPVIDIETARNLGPNERRCPFCAEVIGSRAVKCRHCGALVRKTK